MGTSICGGDEGSSMASFVVCGRGEFCAIAGTADSIAAAIHIDIDRMVYVCVYRSRFDGDLLVVMAVDDVVDGLMVIGAVINGGAMPDA
jgi:hypothetical protein